MKKGTRGREGGGEDATRERMEARGQEDGGFEEVRRHREEKWRYEEEKGIMERGREVYPEEETPLCGAYSFQMKVL